MILYDKEDNHKLEIINEMKHDIPVIISIPHSGSYIPTSMKNKLKKEVILPNTDWYLSSLYTFLDSLGYTIIINHVNRYVIDVNRNVDEKKGTSYKTNTVYTHTTQGDEMYNIPITEKEIQERIKNYYIPYHQLLKKAIKEKLKFFNKVYIIDLHSFGLDYGADVILGNNFNESCSLEVSNFFKNSFLKNGFRVKENSPFTGGYITKNYGEKEHNCEAIQIELWYSSYIQMRNYGKEEYPNIDDKTFYECQKKLESIFCDFKKWLK